jgi:HPt (histidine-containing phosphotransfer) domain-containing protein
LPVIALTANAVSGMREMFLEKGFNDYLAKPIEIAKLNEIIRRWIPKDKQQRSAAPEKKTVETAAPLSESAIQIPGLDTARGIAMTGGVEAGYRKVLASFYRDARERLPSLKEIPDEKNLLAFATQVHAMKSAAATIGAAELSKEAAALEAAGKAGNMAVIRDGLPSFYEHLEGMIEKLAHALGLSQDGISSPPAGIPPNAELQPLFKALRAALETMDIESVDKLLAEIETRDLDAKTKETISAISDLVLITEFEAAITELDALIG